ncbi:MAG: replicative DNA helicase [Ilumatobacteraceae bacterium]
MVAERDEPSRRRSDGRAPPHNLDAEASVLGAMLLSRDAVDAVTEFGLKPGDFYRPANQHIFDAIGSLYTSGEPVDTITVADALRREDLLDSVGGTEALHQLQNATPAISSAKHYAKIVTDTATLRRLIRAASDIAEMAYSGPDDVTKTVDQAEQKVFEIGDEKAADTTRAMTDLISQGMDLLEERYERGVSITGAPTGFHDLDDLLAGLQPSTLNIVGARPAMGKTAFGLGIAVNIAQQLHQPVLVFSLEMGHDELTQRILASEARVDSKRITTGNLSESDWAKIGQAIGRLEVPLFLDDNPRVTVMEIRAKARRLKARHGSLALIVIDYLQLMSTGGGAENRQLEVSEISRNLKVLARELETPILALSQLSRNLESRSDKRPMLSDLRESGCLAAGTRLLRADTNAEVTLGELVETGERDVPVWSLDEQWRLVPATLTHAFPSGVKSVFRMRLASGRLIEATENHRFRTVDGWVSLDRLEIGSRLAVPRRLDGPEHVKPMDPDEIVLLAHLLGDGCVLARQPVHYTNADPANLDVVERAAWRRFGITARRVQQSRWWHSYLPSPHHLTHGRRNPIAAWWDGLGLHDLRSWQKFIPDPVHALPREQLALFLRHLWATDGSLTITRSGAPVRLYYSSTSRRLIDGLQQLLLRFDIQSRVTTVMKGEYCPNYQLRIDGVEHQRRFLTRIGVHGTRGGKVPECLALLDGRVANPNVDTIPQTVRPWVIDALARAGMSHRALAEAIGELYCGSYMLGSERRPREMRRQRLGRIADALESKVLAALADSDVLWDRVVSIEPLGEQPVFDATVLTTHNFVANGVMAHNSLEQDADVVMFLYRDEVYDRDSPDKGSAEVIVAKHRSGPIGSKRLVWLAQSTRFENAARRADI